MALGSIQALQQAGETKVPVTIAEDVAGAVYWKQHPSFVKQGVCAFPPRDEARIAFETAMRTLEGQGPKIESILRQPTLYTYADLSRLLPAGATESSQAWIDCVPQSYYSTTMPQFFTHPSNPLDYKH
jgi:ribose transport system substrate-binding protein